jgi:ATP synthase F1 gamma subunit
MSKVSDLKATVIEYQTAGVTAEALQDISAIRMTAIRRGFEKNRQFYDEIRKLYGIVQSQAKKAHQMAEIAAQKGGTAKARNKRVRQLYIALTSNKRFYGALMRDIVTSLSLELDKAPESSAIIVGRIGWQHYETLGSSRKARQLIWSDDNPSTDELRSLVETFDNFDRILVFYPKFINPFKQEVGLVNVTESISDEADSPAAAESDIGYIFEPEVPAILAFFDTQVQRVLFDRVLLEAELSRTAARLIKMGEAAERAKSLVKTQLARVRRESAAVSNQSLLETFSGFTKWHHV